MAQRGEDAGKVSASRRILLIFVIFACLTLLLIARAAWHATAGAVPDGIQETVLIPGLRGRLLTKDGKLLAWSTRRLRLLWRVPEAEGEAHAVRKRLLEIPEIQQFLPEVENLRKYLGKEIVLLEEASGEPSPDCLVLLKKGVLRWQGYFVRHQAGEAELLGQVATDSETGLEIGHSGLELKYDNLLRGKVMQYSILAGRKKVIQHSRSILSADGDGKDVVVEPFEERMFLQ